MEQKANYRNNARSQALATFLNVTRDEISNATYGAPAYARGESEYLVLTDREADSHTREYIEDSLWSFRTSFILDHIQGRDRAGINWDRVERALEKMQGALCEDANEIVRAMISNLRVFVQDAISADGRGHFLAPYDGAENEQDGFYIYRMN